VTLVNVIIGQLLSVLCCNGAGEDEETKKQKQKALIDAAFKLTAKTENSENDSHVGVDGDEESGDGAFSWKMCVCVCVCLLIWTSVVVNPFWSVVNIVSFDTSKWGLGRVLTRPDAPCGSRRCK